MTLREFKALVDNPRVRDASFLRYLVELHDSDKRKDKGVFLKGVAYLKGRRQKMYNAVMLMLKSIESARK